MLQGTTSLATGTFDVTTAAGITLEGESLDDSFGSAVQVADVNGDGNADLIAGAHYFDGDAASTTGALYGMYGPLSAGTYAASDAAFRIEGAAAGDALGGGVIAVGDFTGDGVEDIAAAQYYMANSFAGGAFLFAGGGM